MVAGGDGLLIAGALAQRECRAGPPFGAEGIALDHVGGSSENWSVMVPLVPCFAARPGST